MPKFNKHIKVCHFSSVHSIYDTRVFNRECASIANDFSVTFIGIGNYTGVKKNVNIIGVKKTSKPWLRFLSTVWIVFAKAIHQNADIYHIHDAEMIPFGLVLSISGKKVVYDIHENTKTDILLKYWIPNYQKKIIANTYDLFLKLAAKYMHFIPVVWREKDVAAFYCRPNQYTIIQNFADHHQLKPYCVTKRAEIAENNLFYIGMLKDMYYNIYQLFDAMLILKQQGINTHLHCVGYFGIGLKNNFNDYERWLEIKDSITYYGKLNIDDAYAISTKCKIGICLKNQPEEMVLSHERKLFEYMAVGLPYISCNKTIYQDISTIFNAGITTNLTNPNDFANAIKTLLLNPTLLNQMALNATKAVAEEINWACEYKKLKNLYLKLVQA